VDGEEILLMPGERLERAVDLRRSPAPTGEVRA
jgi:hypothetical protein